MLRSRNYILYIGFKRVFNSIIFRYDSQTNMILINQKSIFHYFIIDSPSLPVRPSSCPVRVIGTIGCIFLFNDVTKSSSSRVTTGFLHSSPHLLNLLLFFVWNRFVKSPSFSCTRLGKILKRAAYWSLIDWRAQIFDSRPWMETTLITSRQAKVSRS